MGRKKTWTFQRRKYNYNGVVSNGAGPADFNDGWGSGDNIFSMGNTMVLKHRLTIGETKSPKLSDLSKEI